VETCCYAQRSGFADMECMCVANAVIDHLNKCKRYISEAERKRLNEVAVAGKVSALCRSLFVAGWRGIMRVLQRLCLQGCEFETLLLRLGAPEGVEFGEFCMIVREESTK
jgi:hypothetical protein